MSQKVVQYQAALQLAQTAPQLYDLPLLHRQMLDVLGIKNYSKLVPMQDDRKPVDPVTENQNVLMMKPVKAFLYQDHQAHIAVHMSAMQDPKIQQIVGMTPMAQQIQAGMMAHINEHIGYEYRKQMEMRMGVELPPDNKQYEDEGIPEEMEVRISQLAAQAAQQLLQQNQQEAQAQQNAQAQQDPLVQMQQQELQLKQAELQLKQQKLAVDAAAKADQIRVEESRIESQEKVAAMNATIKVNEEAKNRLLKETELGAKLGVDLAKTRAQLNVPKGTQKKGD
jgi:hypothetical protein